MENYLSSSKWVLTKKVKNWVFGSLTGAVAS